MATKAKPKPKKKKLSPEAEAQELLRQHRENLAQKVKDKKPLTQSELKQLQNQAEGGPIGGDIWATSKIKLAEALAISRPTLDKWLKKKGAPTAEPNGQYFVPKFRAFIRPTQGKPGGAAAYAAANHLPDPSLTGEEIAQPGSLREQLLCQKSAIDVQEAVFNLEKKKGEWLPKEEVAEAVRTCNERMMGELTRRLIQIAPKQYEGVAGNAEQCRKINEAHISSLLTLLHSGQW